MKSSKQYQKENRMNESDQNRNNKPAGSGTGRNREQQRFSSSSKTKMSGYGYSKSRPASFSSQHPRKGAGIDRRPNRSGLGLRPSKQNGPSSRPESGSIRVFRSEDTPSFESRMRPSKRDGRFVRDLRRPARKDSGKADSRLKQPVSPELKIQRWGINGEGIAYKNRKPVFVEGVIPDETAVIEITEENDRYAKGKLIRVVESSPRRRHPVCPIADECGGCALMHVDYRGQIRAKEKLLREALKKYAGYTGPIEPMIKNPVPLGYRNACKFPMGLNEEGQISTGMYERNSNRFVPVPRCVIHSKKLEAARHQVEDILRKYDMRPYDKETGTGLRNLVMKEFDGRVHIILVTSELDLPEAMVNDLLALENAGSVWQSVKDDSDMEFEMFGNRMIHLGGDMKMTLSLKDLSLELLPRSFFQLNTAQAQQLYDLVVSWVPENTGLIVEAYSGIGAMSLFAADKADEVIGIEVVEDAVANARDNALANGRENVRFICGDAGQELEKIADSQNVDVLIVDPPRSGLNQKMKDSIHQAAPERIIYVSCNSATLGKDLADLFDLYEVDRIQPFDMFSQTPQIETAVLLEKKA